MARVKVEIHGDSSHLESALKKAEHSLEGLKEMVIGAFTVEAVKEMVTSTVELGTTLTNTALRLDMTVEQVQVLKQAAKDSGIEFEKLQAVLDKISVAKAKALGGDKDALKAFGEFGIGQQQLKTTRSVDLLFNQIAESVKANGSEAIAGPLSEIVGKGFGEIVPLLKEDIGEVGDDLKKIGGVMSTDTAVKLKVLGDQFELLGTQLETILGPAIINTVMAFENGISRYLHFIDKLAGNDKSPEKDKPSSWQDIWTNTKGVTQGLVGSLEVVASGGGLLGHNALYEHGTDVMAQAQMKFEKTGFTGGIIDRITDEMVKGHSLGDKFDNAFIKPMEEKAAKLKAQILGGSDKTVDVTPVAKEQAQKHFRVYSDSMTTTGNMLGHSFSGLGASGTFMDVAKNQLTTQKQMKDNLETIKASMTDLSTSVKLAVAQGWS